MLDMDEINKAIYELERGKTTYSAVEKLAALYAIRDHADTPTYEAQASRAPEPYIKPAVSVRRDSDFLAAVDGKDPEAAWLIIDELMDNLRVINSRVYESVLRKIKAI